MEAASAAQGAERRPTLLEAAAIAVAISTVLNALGVFTEEAIHWLNLVVGFLIAAVAAALVFAVLALLTVPVFWSGLPPVFGVAAIYLGRRFRDRAGLAAMVIGAIALVADVAAYATDIASRA